MSEENFLKLYPDEQGYRFFLLRTPPGQDGQGTAGDGLARPRFQG